MVATLQLFVSGFPGLYLFKNSLRFHWEMHSFELIVLVVALAVPCWANYVLLQQKYTADPAPLVYQDRVCVQLCPLPVA